MVRVSIDSSGNLSGRSLHKPGLEAFLRTVGLDLCFTRGVGDSLFYRNQCGQEVEVLDLVGGFGTLLLGHNHPEITRAATDFLGAESVNHAQGSIRIGAKQLADVLNRRAGGNLGVEYCSVFSNSGAEAVEVSLKHAMLETGHRTFIALERAFHGKTLGALQANGNAFYRHPFSGRSPHVVRVNPDRIDDLKSAFDRIDDLAGFLFEPIQGEAGVRPISQSFLHVASELCARRGVPMIADECQTGLGRTGTFLASEAYGVQPDYIIFSKALGGGLAKVSATLIRQSRYRLEFDLLHSSTFADDGFSCHLALRSLELLDDATIKRGYETGEWFLRRLRELGRRFPEVIEDVRGRGLMIGLQLRRPDRLSGFTLNHLADRSLLGPFVAGYLLHDHQIRVAPTISDPSSIRLQPSLLVSRRRLDDAVTAIEDVCKRIADRDLPGLTRYLANRPNVSDPVPALPTSAQPIFRFDHSKLDRLSARAINRNGDLNRVAWLFHLIDCDDLIHLDAGFSGTDSSIRDGFCERWGSLSEPVVMNPVTIESATGQKVRLFPIMLPVTSAWMLRHGTGSQLRAPQQLVQRGVEVASRLKCDVVSLGQFTSIVTRRGRSLDDRGMQLTSGNNYTAALICQSILSHVNRQGRDPETLRLGIVGASGDVARTSLSMLSHRFRQCILVGSGREGAFERLSRMAESLPGAIISNDIRAIESADVVVCATNSTAAPVHADHLKANAIVCDASVPASLHGRLHETRPDVTVVPGAVVRLPGSESIDIPGFPLPPGMTFGCMAEGLLIGLDGTDQYRWSGRSTEQRASIMAQLAQQHGFAVAESTRIVRHGAIVS